LYRRQRAVSALAWLDQADRLLSRRLHGGRLDLNSTIGRIEDQLEMTRNDQATEIPIKECLKSLGLSFLSEWDVLMFLYRHQFSLASAEQIGRLLGYPSKTVG